MAGVAKLGPHSARPHLGLLGAERRVRTGIHLLGKLGIDDSQRVHVALVLGL